MGVFYFVYLYKVNFVMSKTDKLKEKYKGKINSRTFEIFVQGDSTPTKKYLEYMCNLWVTTRNLPLSANRPRTSKEVVEYVQSFDKHLPYINSKDIYAPYYSQYHNLVKTVNDAQELKKDKEFVREEHIEVLVENDDYLLLKPKTLQGSLKYGANTRWCTASKSYPHHFVNYTRNGYLFYLIRKNTNDNKWDKVAFYQVSSNVITGEMQIFAADDLRAEKRNIFKDSDWGLDTFMEIMLIIQSYVYKEEYYKTAKENVQDVINKLSSIKIPRLMKSLSVVSDEESGTMKNNIDSLISELKKSLVK